MLRDGQYPGNTGCTMSYATECPYNPPLCAPPFRPPSAVGRGELHLLTDSVDYDELRSVAHTQKGDA